MKKIISLALAAVAPLGMFAQGAFDAAQISQPDLKGTARFMSMGGAFGALGGDLSTLSQNPAGIGVYRRSELGFTLDLDLQSTKANSQGFSTTQDQTKFLLNNIGGVATLRLNSDACPNLNFGFTYNKAASFNRHFRGGVPQLANSMSNYIASVTQGDECTVGDLTTDSKYDPYNPPAGYFAPAWISVLGYDSYLISPVGNPDSPEWVGQFGNGTSGNGSFDWLEKGGIDEYNISLGGNISNVVFWGMDFAFTNLNYKLESLWSESLTNAYVNERTGITSAWDLYNYYKINGTGFNYKIGLILKPVNEFRLGFAVHTPTWYHLDEAFYGSVDYSYAGNSGIADPNGWAETNNGYDGVNSYKFRSPWKFIASAALVLGSNLIVSADYEWTSFSTMQYSEDNGYYGGGYDYDYDWDWDWSPSPYHTRSLDSQSPYYYTNSDIKNYFRKTSTLRVGAEFRVTPQFSVRAGYCYVDSPVKNSVADNNEIVYTVGTRPQYVVDRSTNYITCGLGYKYQNFYIDAAYVYKHRSSDFHAFTPDPKFPNIPSPQAHISDRNSQIVLSMGFRF